MDVNCHFDQRVSFRPTGVISTNGCHFDQRVSFRPTGEILKRSKIPHEVRNDKSREE
jgi:hypothetical protein